MNNTLRQVANPKATLREVPSPSWNRLSFSRWAPIPLRLIVGYGFMAHGFAKLGKGPDAFASILHALGVPHRFHGVGHDTDRIARRFGSYPGSFRDS